MSTIPKKLQDFLDEAKTRKFPATPAKTRLLSEEMANVFAISKIALPLIVERSIPMGQYAIPVHIYHPSPDVALPLILYFHGGGHVSGSLESYDGLCQTIANSCQCVLMSVGYRLAPEFPFPAGIEDCIAAFNKRLFVLKGVKVNLNQVVIVGDSAGGNLALTIAHQIKKIDRKSLKGLGLIYPSVDFTMGFPSIQRNGRDYLLTTERIQWFFDHYFALGEDRRQASPIYFDELDGLPPLYLAVAEFDPLYDEALAFVEKARNSGLSVEVEEFKGMIHGFVQLYSLVPKDVLHLIQSLSHFICAQLK